MGMLSSNSAEGRYAGFIFISCAGLLGVALTGDCKNVGNQKSPKLRFKIIHRLARSE